MEQAPRRAQGLSQEPSDPAYFLAVLVFAFAVRRRFAVSFFFF
jgi:hypothetical protein